MMLSVNEGHASGTVTAGQEGRGRDWTTIDVRGEWAWSATEPVVQTVPPGGAGTELGSGVPWLWQLLSYVATGGEERSGLLRLATAAAEQPVRARALNALGRFAWQSGDVATARTFYQEALVIGRATRDYASRSCSLSGLATVSVGGGAYDLARGLLEECLDLRRRSGDRDGVARALAMLGWLAAERGSPVEARALLDESLTVRHKLGECRTVAMSLLHLGWLAQLQHDRCAARRFLAESLDAVWHREDRWKIVALLGVLGRPPLVGTMLEQAVRLLAGAEALDEPTTSLGPEEDRRARQRPDGSGRLSAPELAAAWADGCATSVEALVERVLRASPPVTPRGGRGAHAREVLVLTPREREVATLVGRGYTNHRIADALVITERTAETHVRNIREKLGFATRAQVAAWAAEYGLLSKPGA